MDVLRLDFLRKFMKVLIFTPRRKMASVAYLQMV